MSVTGVKPLFTAPLFFPKARRKISLQEALGPGTVFARFLIAAASCTPWASTHGGPEAWKSKKRYGKKPQQPISR
jgi:hypothetical protein